VAGAFGGVRVTGLRELVRACDASAKEIKRGVRSKLKHAGEVVRVEAEHRAPSEIRNIGPTWGRFRVGMTTSYVYVAPKQRRHGGTPRRNLADLLLNRVMVPALEAKTNEVERSIEEAIDEIAVRHW
jgi:hypothetical protein